ncbi:pantothenate synthetase 1 [Gemmatimonadetes bacterium T265]|nr:pantothenate synthetase 1 [Gemmatimonadetes bacterium T265]
MRTVTTTRELRVTLDGARNAQRAEGARRVAFVPTMGALHDGHLALVDEARRRADVVVMSIFVNPLQFAPTDDFARYPRDPDGDAAKAAARGVDVLFTPDAATLYPREPRVRVVPGPIADRWEGAVRPGHFVGVLTVVAKLLHLVQPDVAVFGQKDAQQVAVVRAMIEDLDVASELVVVPTAREADGLARSSRNVYLDAEARRRAGAIPGALATMERAFAAGERDSAALAALVARELADRGGLTADYVAITDPATLEPVAHAAPGTLVMVAARVGPARLLDTIVLGEPRFGTGLTEPVA